MALVSFWRTGLLASLLWIPLSGTIAANPAVSSTYTRYPFADVSPDYWAADFITVLYQNAMIQGFPDATFRPNQPISRGEYASLLYRVQTISFTLPVRDTNTLAVAIFPATPQWIYPDVSPQYWAAQAISAVTRWGFLEGFPDGRFRPHHPITRLEVLLSLADSLPSLSPEQVTDSLAYYHDQSTIPRYGREAIARVTMAEQVVNYPVPRFLNPNRAASRAEVAALVAQFLVRRNQLDPIVSPYVVRWPPEKPTTRPTSTL